MIPLSSADTVEETPEAPAVDEARDALLERLGAELGDAVVGTHVRPGDDVWVRVTRAAWRETGLYSARERAALNWAETMTRMVEHHGSRDADFDLLKGQFSDQEIVELSWFIAQINAWNRMAVGMHAPVAEKEIA